MAWGWDESRDAHEQVYGEENRHEGKLSHELLAGAASFAGFKAFEDYQRKQGKPVSHAFAKEALVGLVGAEVDKLIETKGLDEVDKIKAHRHAKEIAENMYDEHYQDADQYDPERYEQHSYFN
ncbi:hypothetical protein VTN02DRAFT_1133 [Thermoascus thermophilus]